MNDSATDTGSADTGSADTRARCESALERLKQCYDRQLASYGETGLQEVKRMENEAPTPSPCVDEYNKTVEALLAYEGSPEDFELGPLGPALCKTVAERRR